jgi:hypothetical protein
LTGKPPCVGATFESVRVQAGRGKLEDCFARLDASGAEPEPVALYKQWIHASPAHWETLGDAIPLRLTPPSRVGNGNLRCGRVAGASGLIGPR